MNKTKQQQQIAIKEIIQESGLTRKELSVKMKKSERYIYSLIDKPDRLTFKNAIILGRITGMPITELSERVFG